MSATTADAESAMPTARPHTVQPAAEVVAKVGEFPELTPATVGPGMASLDSLLDVNIVVTAELGRASLSVGELLKLGAGAVVELSRLVSDPVDLMAQGVRLGRGEVVVVDDHFAIRIKELADPRKRSGP